MTSEAAVRQAFAKQAAICIASGAPFTGRVCGLVGERLDRGTSIGDRLLHWPGNPSHQGDALPLRLAGGLHALAGAAAAVMARWRRGRSAGERPSARRLV